MKKVAMKKVAMMAKIVMQMSKYAETEFEKWRRFTVTKNMQRNGLASVPIPRMGILVMCMLVGFMGACCNCDYPSVSDIALEPEQMRKGDIPTGLKITMTKEVKSVKVDSFEATGADKTWRVKLEMINLKEKIKSHALPQPVADKLGARVHMQSDTLGTVSESVPLTITWTNKDDTIEATQVAVLVDVVEKKINADVEEKKINRNFERQLTSVCLISQ